MTQIKPEINAVVLRENKYLCLSRVVIVGYEDMNFISVRNFGVYKFLQKEAEFVLRGFRAAYYDHGQSIVLKDHHNAESLYSQLTDLILDKYEDHEKKRLPCPF